MEQYLKASQLIQNMELHFNLDTLSVDIDFIRVEFFKPGCGFDSHMHSNYEFHYIKSGMGCVEINRENYELKPGSLYVCSPHIIHRQIADRKDPMVEYALKCSLHIDPETAGRHDDYVLMKKSLDNTRVTHDRFSIHTVFEEVFSEAVHMNAGFTARIKCCVLKILSLSAANLDAGHHPCSDSPVRNYCKTFTLAVKYIHDNMNRYISCRELAKHTFLSEKQLNRVILKKTGLTTHRFIMSCKLTRAKKLLSESDKKLADIAECTGFSSQFHLSARFKEFLGISPDKYRKTTHTDNDDTVFSIR